MRKVFGFWIGLALAALPLARAAETGITVTVRNPIALARPSETIVLSADDLRKFMGVDDVRKIHVRDPKSSKDLLVQAVDLNDDYVYDQLLFQTDLAPNETRTFMLSVGALQIPQVSDYKTYGRFVRERRDDFAWENDRIAHRMYGKELETWPHEPLTSSAVDVWSKRTRRLVINDWYLMDDYHRDHGEGGDFYSANKSRGCGGSGLWFNGKLFSSANFRESRVYAVGPIRVLFELKYESWTVDGVHVTETKRISLDAGQNLDRFESHYTFDGNPGEIEHAVGIKKSATSVKDSDQELGMLRTWEPVKGHGELGCGVLVDPSTLAGFTDDANNFLVLTRIKPGAPSVYYAGFGWTGSGDFKDAAAWDKYLADFAQRLRAPVEVQLIH